MTCNHSENQSFGADDRKETKIEVRTNTNGPKLEQTRCHFGAKWSTSWRKIVQKWGPPVTDEGQTDLDHPAPRAWSFEARWQASASPPNSNKMQVSLWGVLYQIGRCKQAKYSVLAYLILPLVIEEKSVGGAIPIVYI